VAIIGWGCHKGDCSEVMQSEIPLKRDVVIIGAGAAGLVCAIETGKRHRSVLVLDHMEKIGKKIRASGGGALQFYELKPAARQLLFRKSPFLQIGPCPLYSARFHLHVRQARDRIC
jgi:2-polyprenyl-6-methoxyphenol hydroxylase-like FAD-dependent oxidoreductase